MIGHQSLGLDENKLANSFPEVSASMIKRAIIAFTCANGLRLHYKLRTVCLPIATLPGAKHSGWCYNNLVGKIAFTKKTDLKN